MIPKKIHYCWLSGDPLPGLFQECVDSWRRVMPDYEIVLWDKEKFDVSSKPFVKEACEVKKWAFASDYIRLYAIHMTAGSWRSLQKEPLLKRLRIAFQNSNFLRRIFNRKLLRRDIKYMTTGKEEIAIEFYTIAEFWLKTIEMGSQPQGTYRLEEKHLEDLPRGKYVCRIKQDDKLIQELFFLK